MKRRLIVIIAAFATAFAALPAGAAPDRGLEASEAPASVQDLALDRPISVSGVDLKIDAALVGATGRVVVSVRLSEPAAPDGDSKKLAAIERQQARLISKAERGGAIGIGNVKRVLNAVFLEMDAAAINDLAADPNVISIKRVSNYELDLSETVPYIGGTDVQQELGFDGTGVTVAVLDSGVDYTHADLGGPGTLAAYQAAYGENTLSGKNRKTNDRYKGEVLFPTDKVIGGYDFVGEQWPNGNPNANGGGNGVVSRLIPDPDPIDFEGHGTHVADIIAGVNGVAPGADILAVKVCSAVSSACSGVALIQGMEYAVENGADIINMSLGSVYGQAFDDDLAAAVEGATAAGVLTVASAGNSADKPYVTGTPAAAPSALSVAQTSVPSEELQLLAVGGASYKGVFQPWSAPPAGLVTAELQYGDSDGTNLLGCDPFTGNLTGKAVLVDRGACSFTLKIANIADAGGTVGIIGLVAPGAPFAGGFDGAACGTSCDDIPGYMITQADSRAFKAAVGSTFTIDPDNTEPLVGSLVGSSSRGPSMQYNLVKPEIGAPGASVSAEVGTGTGTTPFGGTSGAAPMVAGSAALLLSAEPGLAPAEAKARLINTAETEIYSDPFNAVPGLAPISRIGGGEVRVDRAVAADAAAWEADVLQGALSFGFVDATGVVTASKTIVVKNYGDVSLTFDIEPTFRYPSDAALGAVKPSVSVDELTVPAGETGTFTLTAEIDGALLPDWYGNSGSRGASTAWLTDLEIDGYLLLDADGTTNDIHLPWHVLPRKAADIEIDGGAFVNSAVNDGFVEGFNLYAVSEDLPSGPEGGQAPVIDLQYVGGTSFLLPDEFCEEDEDLFPSLAVGFAVNTWERQTHANAPALFEFDLDIDQDGVFDYAVYNADLSLASGNFNLGDGRNVVYAQNLATGDTIAGFFTDHETNSANTVLYVCGEWIGIEFEDLLEGPIAVDVQALAVDIYFTGQVTDAASFTMTPGYERYLPYSGPVPAGGSAPVAVTDLGPAGGSELGALFLYRGGAPVGSEADIILAE